MAHIMVPSLQAIFASNLFIGSVVAVVGGCITPAGIYLVKKLTSCLSPKAALITSLQQVQQFFVEATHTVLAEAQRI